LPISEKILRTQFNKVCEVGQTSDYGHSKPKKANFEFVLNPYPDWKVVGVVYPHFEDFLKLVLFFFVGAKVWKIFLLLRYGKLGNQSLRRN
jgi:hypothetical protein